MVMRNTVAALFLTLGFAFVIGGYAQDTLVPAILAFGDSAVDVGNNNYLPTRFKANYPPYGKDFIGHRPTGRFSNGKLAIDIIAETLGFKTPILPYLSPEASGSKLLTGASFGSAASGYDTKAAIRHHAIPLPQQLEFFKEYQVKLAKVAGRNKSESIIRDALYVLGAGTADFMQNYYSNPSLSKAYTHDQYSSFLLRQFESFVKGLYGLGARKLGVTSLIPLGCIPAARTLYGANAHKCVSRINSDAQNFNGKLNSTAASLRKQLPNLKIVVFDIFQPLYSLFTSPQAYGFVEGNKGCCGTTNTEEIALFLCNPKLKGTCSNATEYVFWDGIHLSQAANQIVAEESIVQGVSLV